MIRVHVLVILMFMLGLTALVLTPSRNWLSWFMLVAGVLYEEHLLTRRAVDNS